MIIHSRRPIFGWPPSLLIAKKPRWCGFVAR